MEAPSSYTSLTLPVKLPAEVEPIVPSQLPSIGFLEHTLGTTLVAALTALGEMKPKFPDMSVKESALKFLALHLRGLCACG
jgi:adenylate/nucleoside-diphosphate kinase